MSNASSDYISSVEPKKNWFVYVLFSDKCTYYTGITNAVPRRMAEHNSGENRSTRGRKWTIAYLIFGVTQLEAAMIERWLKSGDTVEKRQYIDRLAIANIEANVSGCFRGNRCAVWGRPLVTYLLSRQDAKRRVKAAWIAMHEKGGS